MFAMGAIAGCGKRRTGGGRLTHFVKHDWTQRSKTVTTETEESNYTVTWSELTAAGFAAGDTVGVIITLKQRTSNNAGYSRASVKQGSTFAGAAQLTFTSIESEQTAGGGNMFILPTELTLAANDNFYIGSWTNSTYTNYLADYTFFIFKTSDLGSSNYKFANNSHSGDAPSTYTDSSQLTLGAGDWLVFASTYWYDDNTTAIAQAQVLLDGVQKFYSENYGEDTENSFLVPIMGYLPGVTEGQVLKVQYKATSATHDLIRTRLMAIRLNAFRSYWGDSQTGNLVQHTVLNDWKTVASNGTFAPAATGPFMSYYLPRGDCQIANQRPKSRILVDGVNQPSDTANDQSCFINRSTTGKFGAIAAAYLQLAQGSSYSLAFQACEVSTIATPYYTAASDAVIFSLDLA